MLKTDKGFSLVEAIVALVVLSLVFSAVWGWFGTAATSTSSIERALGLPEVFSQFRVRLELETLRDTSNGEYQIGQYQVRWQAKENRNSKQETYRRQPAWIVSLYEVEGQISRGGKTIDTFTTQLVQQWRDPDYIEFNG